MTMAPADWCPTCSDRCLDHPSVCTVCGDSLTNSPPPPPPPPAAASAASGAPTATGRGGRAASAAAAAAAIEARLAAIVGSRPPSDFAAGAIDAAVGDIGAVGSAGEDEGDDDDDGGGGWQTPAAEAMDPAASRGRDRPTSRECIDRIPRIEVDERSSVLHECTVEVVPPPPTGEGGGLRREALRFDAVIAEFGPPPPYTVSGRAVAVSPSTGRGGLSSQSAASLGSGRTVAFMERGGSVTFAAKALMAQDAGASAVVVGNNVGVWPYVMRDSSGEASKGGLTIPVVMVKRADGARMRGALVSSGRGASVRCSLTARRAARGHGGDCVVCADPFAAGDTAVRLPTCGHCFHENCALRWLGRHNTCPYCRRELPAEDGEYEAERRRRARTHAGGGGGEPDEERWGGIFG